ncbi:RNase H domain-containing protein [Trichonephila clavata]|uniref:RNase H domain-containing protein n=1 Tax=Trichonephila clavata TaxID=2740835 RepID=A0A8X6HTS6_TRICU|nr:RNase H domain-containing protein [Trichonephila clavata]
MSHVNFKYDDVADDLAKGGTSMTQVNEEPLTYLELYSKCKASINISWKQLPSHLQYLSQCPGASTSFKVTGEIKLLLIDCPWCI